MGEDLKKEEFPKYMHLICGWPLVLVAVGGAIGGGLGGLAYGMNVSIFNKTRSIPVTVLSSILTGGVAIAVWLAIAVAISTPDQPKP